MKDENTEELVGRRLKAYEKIIDNRKYYVRTIYGPEAAKKYVYLRDEKEYFGWHGHLPEYAPAALWDESNTARQRTRKHHADFYEFCDNQYPVQRDAYFSRIEMNRKNAQSWPEYQKQQKDRDQLAAYLKAQAAQNS